MPRSRFGFFRRNSRSGIRAALLALAGLAIQNAPAQAYNQDFHKPLVDYAWQIMLAIDAIGRGGTSPDQPFRSLAISDDLSRRTQEAVRRIQNLPANLPPPKDERCADPALIAQLGTNTPNWNNNGDFFNMPIGSAPFPVALDYASGKDCGIQVNWSPGQAYQLINTRDRSGAILGYWAQYPDTLEDDFHVGIKPTSTGGLSLLKEGLIAAGALPAATIWVPVKCGWKCLKSLVSFSPGDCEACCKDAVRASGNASRDIVSGIDSFVPILGDFKSDQIVGMSHHINVPLANSDYDDISGLLITRAGPLGVPGALEVLATAVADAAGATVRYDDSDAPKNYEIINAQDGSANSRHRSATDWESLPFPHVAMPPVDNLARYGFGEFNKPPGRQTKFLGYALHAIADATVPMHVAGAFGWGHRPYEDAVSAIADLLLAGDRRSEPIRLNTIILPRVEAYYKIITDWRAANPGQASDVPIRAIVTAAAQTTWAIAKTDPTLFDDALSVGYLADGLDVTTAAYTLKRGVMRQFVDEAVAASIAFLIATGEVLP